MDEYNSYYEQQEFRDVGAFTLLVYKYNEVRNSFNRSVYRLGLFLLTMTTPLPEEGATDNVLSNSAVLPPTVCGPCEPVDFVDLLRFNRSRYDLEV
jgi:hypothetical protein